MNELFVDTAGWASLFDLRQKYHLLAVDVVHQMTQAGRQAITTNLVLIELTALLTRPLRLAKPKQLTILSTIKTAKWLRVIDIDVSSET